VISVALPQEVNAAAVADALERRGAVVGARSRYLRQRNWLQVALMGTHDLGQLSLLSVALVEACAAVRMTTDEHREVEERDEAEDGTLHRLPMGLVDRDATPALGRVARPPARAIG
jgi:hypothetical protein